MAPTLLLVAPSQPHQFALRDNLSALATAYSGTVHWFGYGNGDPEHLPLKHLPRCLVPGAWVLVAQPLPTPWLTQALDIGCRVVLLRTPLLRGLAKVDPRYEIWHLDSPHRAQPWWAKATLANLWRRRQQHFNAWYCPPQSASAGQSCLYLLSRHTSPGERELVSEVAQVVALRLQSDATLMAPGALPPVLNHVAMVHTDGAVLPRIQAAGRIISDNWHWLLCAQSLGRPTLALTHPGQPLYKLARRLKLPVAPLLRHPLTDAILALQSPVRRPLANGLPDALAALKSAGSAPSLATVGPRP